VITKSNKIW